MSTLTADPKVGVVEPWVSGATVGYNKDRVEHYGDELDDDDYFGEEPLPEGWEEELKNDPEFMAELELQCDQIDAEMAAGTWVGTSNDEMFENLYKRFPHLRGVKHG